MAKERFWNDGRDEKLAELWPTHSATQIAAVLGCTRNMVIGRIHRLLGTEFPSDLIKKRDSAIKAERNRERRQQRRELLKAQIMRARERGLSYRKAGQALGISEAAAWRREHGRVNQGI